jgi:hypothetical protein
MLIICLDADSVSEADIIGDGFWSIAAAQVLNLVASGSMEKHRANGLMRIRLE